MTLPSQALGCNACLPLDACSAWEAVKSLTVDAEFVDESHFTLMLLSCPACEQHFVKVFTETIDWVDSEDPQAWSVLPVTQEESRQLRDSGDDLLSLLAALAPGRRSLCREFPKGESPRSSWCCGLVLGPHD